MKLSTKILTLILAALGFAACERKPVMYGQPVANFRLQVKVVDSKTGDHIDGILIQVKGLYSYSMPVVMMTNEYGRAYCDEIVFPKDCDVTIVAQDIDGDQNGLYKKDSVKFELKASDYSGGDGSWYDGSQSKAIDLKLEKVTE